MGDKLGLVLNEGSSAEDVVGMGVGKNDVTDGQRRVLADGCPQTSPILEAAAGIQGGDRAAADDEPDVRDSICIGSGRVFIDAGADENPSGDFFKARFRFQRVRSPGRDGRER